LAALLDDIRTALRRCAQQLRVFDKITEKYAASLGNPGGTGKRYKDLGRKLQWGEMRGEVLEVLEVFQRYVSVVELLFTLYQVWVYHKCVYHTSIYLIGSRILKSNPAVHRESDHRDAGNHKTTKYEVIYERYAIMA
jgi:hypothetical protein